MVDPKISILKNRVTKAAVPTIAKKQSEDLTKYNSWDGMVNRANIADSVYTTEDPN